MVGTRATVSPARRQASTVSRSTAIFRATRSGPMVSSIARGSSPRIRPAQGSGDAASAAPRAGKSETGADHDHDDARPGRDYVIRLFVGRCGERPDLRDLLLVVD